MAISLLANIEAEECYGNIFSENCDKNHYKNCRNGIRNFFTMPNLKQFLQKFYVGPICATTLKNTATEENLIKNDADPETACSSTDFIKNKADLVNISAIKEELRASLLSIASRLLKSEHTRLHHLSEEEQQLWNLFEKADIYEFLTGEKAPIPEFQFNWISPEAPAICQVHSAIPAQPVAPLAAPPVAPPVLVQPAAPPPVVQPAPADRPVDAQLPVQLLPLPHPAQEADIANRIPLPEVPKAVHVKPPIQESDRQLRQQKEIDYNKLNTGIKKTCPSLRQKAKAVVTKLAPGALSPQPALLLPAKR
jgi:hypothetical protein